MINLICFIAVSDVVSFNGSSLIRMDLLREPVETDRHFIRFRFKTNNADGVLMYSRGTQGDYIALQLRDNRMLLNIDLGSRIMTSLSVGSLLDDNMWHDVLISRNRKNISFSVDRVLIKGRIKGEFHRLDLNREVSTVLGTRIDSLTVRKFVYKEVETCGWSFCKFIPINSFPFLFFFF